MNERIRQALKRVEVDWPMARAAQVRVLVESSQRRAEQTRRRLLALAAAVAAVLALWTGLGHRGARPGGLVSSAAIPPSSLAASVSEPPVRTMTFPDGSTVTLLNAATSLKPLVVNGAATHLELSGGLARFQVTHRPERTFRVSAGGVSIDVLGTGFLVESEPDQVRVWVDHGTVRVRSGNSQRLLEAGESASFPSPDTALPDSATAARDVETQEPPAREASDPVWRELARRGEYERGYAKLRAEPTTLRDEPADLLLAADLARLSHHPAEAIPYLRKLVERHPGDKRAAQAAFTMGRLFLEQLGRPRDAAAAFARSRSLDERGALAEDALAREVEARVASGDTERARSLARDYEKAYPAGIRRLAVRRIAGLQ